MEKYFIVKTSRRLDRLEVEDLRISRAALQRFIKNGDVKVNGKAIKVPHFRVKPGDKVSVESQKSTPAPKIAPFDYKKNFEDRFMVIIEKPPFIRAESLIPQAKRHELFLVHRLDKNTSGLLVIAKGEETLVILQRQWKEHTVKKTYIALLKGILAPQRGRIEAPIFRSLKNRKRMAVSSLPRARAASTEYKAIRYFKNEEATLIYAYPLTGRTHQIRIHFASIGYPIIGDTLYGDKKLNTKFECEYRLKRQFLHAHKLALTHPTTKKQVTFTSKLPQDLREVLEQCQPSNASLRLRSWQAG